jgi:preprotein translocase subunit SecA
MSILNKIFVSSNDRQVNKLMKIADAIDALEESMQKLSDDELRNKTVEFKNRLKNGETLDDILPEAFAVVREAAVRIIGQRHFREQLVVGIVMHQGRIAEMKTGEGKTLVATLPGYLNALEGKGVHLVTVNDYLARFHSEWMGKIYNFLGLSVGLVVHGMSTDEKRRAYNADITYGTNNEYGFDYLRDNMVIRKENRVQRGLHFSMIDEVDSILIDEARTPLIISGAGEKSTDLYLKADNFVKRLKERIVTKEEEEVPMLLRVNNFDEEQPPGDYIKDEKLHTVNLTDDGVKKAEVHFGIENLGDIENSELSHHINQALKARYLMFKDKDYIVKDGEVVIVDEFTGRLMTGRRYSDGLHQAIEAKEGVSVRSESKTLATITFQNYFRMYKKLSGMTATAKTEEDELRSIYGMDVVVIPTHKPMIRDDQNDAIYRTIKGKFDAVVEDIVRCNEVGQPVLVGTVSVEMSERLSSLLKRRGIKHTVLNAKYHEQEAEIVAQAGKKGNVTIATNMAGRGTDIKLGGNPEFIARKKMLAEGYDRELIELAESHIYTENKEILDARNEFNRLHQEFKKETDKEHDEVVALGGLRVIGTERHESRRIDNQLRGRSGRQGDPGSSKFYVSVEDDLMRLFGGEQIETIMGRMGMDDEMPLEFGILSRQIENAQKRVEARHFDSRKHVLQYDDVMNRQREIIYDQRRRVLEGENLKPQMIDMIDQLIDRAVGPYTAVSPYAENWDLDGLFDYMHHVFLPNDYIKLTKEEQYDLTVESLTKLLKDAAHTLYDQKEKEIIEQGGDMREVERVILLRVVDQKWMDHIDAMDRLRLGVGLRAYGQRDPIVEYRMEGFEMFDEMVNSIQEDTMRLVYSVSIRSNLERRAVGNITAGKENIRGIGGTTNKEGTKTPIKVDKKVGRNEPCPCGSGKKYKNCCGK